MEDNTDVEPLPCLQEVNPLIAEKLRLINGEDLKAMLHAEGIQDQIFKLSVRLLSLQQDRVQQGQKIAELTLERDAAVARHLSLEEETGRFISYITNEEDSLKAFIIKTLQQMDTYDGYVLLLSDLNLSEIVFQLCTQFQTLSSSFERQKKEIAELSAERDATKKYASLLAAEMNDLIKQHRDEKIILSAEIDEMHEEIKNLKFVDAYNQTQYANANLFLKNENDDLRGRVGNYEFKVEFLENNLDALKKEETTQKELMLLKRANAEKFLVDKLCRVESKNQVLLKELQELYSCNSRLEKKFENMQILLQNYSFKYGEPSFDGEELGEETGDVNCEQPLQSGENYSNLLVVNHNIVSTFELALRKKLSEAPNEVEDNNSISDSFHSCCVSEVDDSDEFSASKLFLDKKLPAGEAGTAEAISFYEFVETGTEVSEDFHVKELLPDSSWHRPVWSAAENSLV